MPRLPADEVRRQAAGLVILSLFSGGKRPEDGMDVYVRQWGAAIETFDLEVSDDHDLADAGFWQVIIDDLKAGKFHAGMHAPPCGSFCASRGLGGGPRALRGPVPPEIFGFPNLEPHEKETVRIGTLLALRTKESCAVMHSLGLPFIYEQPARRPGQLHRFALPDVAVIFELPGVKTKRVVQCMLGSRTAKPTDLAHFEVDRSMFPTQCRHDPQWWARS